MAVDADLVAGMSVQRARQALLEHDAVAIGRQP
jgi:hypothetical protein